MPEFWIGKRRYPTKGAATEAVRTVLYRYQVGETVDQEEDHLLLVDLLDMHHEAKDKIGPGIEAFAVVPPQRGPYPGFEVVRTDGTRIDFSYQTCLKPPTVRQQVLNVMRDEVKGQINSYFEERKEANSLVSDQSGKQLDSTNTAVSYFQGPAFVDIAEEFAAMVGGWAAIAMTPSTEPGLGRIADRALAEQWKDHHRERSVLGLLSTQENLCRPRR
ncbi:DCL family protein [Streptomyces sioyaensis]|uniref:DCL family protein n=1 Tax=Streptomyces sioyaensis TaxID=67364 RepID=UPI0036557110